MPDVRTAIVGSKFHEGAIARLARLPKGRPVTLRREPDNEHDPLAIACFDGDQHLGYVPRNCPTKGRIARALDSGAIVPAIIDAQAIVERGEVRFAPKIVIRLED